MSAIAEAAGYEITEDQANILRAAAGMKEYDANGQLTELPKEIVNAYVSFRTIRDRIDMSAIDTDTLALLVLMAGKFAPAEVKRKTAYDLFKEGSLKNGDSVTVLFRKKDCPATFIGGCGSSEEVIVQIVGDSEERRVPVDTVKVK